MSYRESTIRRAPGHQTAQHWTPLIAGQLAYSLAERRIELQHVLVSWQMGLGITPFALLAEGLLSGEHRP
ncbi:MAG TPA: hypothetical protein VMJ65_19035 [Solirubrobacteraceae bacterium]|nr:hypothetical protein [Solirubrobacteraceae bacterium]